MPDATIVSTESQGDPSVTPDFSLHFFDGVEPSDINWVLHVKHDLPPDEKAGSSMVLGLAILVADQQDMLAKLIESLFPFEEPTNAQVERYLHILLNDGPSNAQ